MTSRSFAFGKKLVNLLFSRIMRSRSCQAKRSTFSPISRFLGIALGSLHELEAVLELVESLEYIPSEEIAVVKAKRADCARMVYGVIRRLG